jgi:hypothetical protein
MLYSHGGALFTTRLSINYAGYNMIQGHWQKFEIRWIGDGANKCQAKCQCRCQLEVGKCQVSASAVPMFLILTTQATTGRAASGGGALKF